jgi:hypothetical protein
LAGPVAVKVKVPEPVLVQDPLTAPVTEQVLPMVVVHGTPGVPDVGGVGGTPMVGVFVRVGVAVGAVPVAVAVAVGGVPVTVGVGLATIASVLTTEQVLLAVPPVPKQAWLVVVPTAALGLTRNDSTTVSVWLGAVPPTVGAVQVICCVPGAAGGGARCAHPGCSFS